MPEGKKRKNYTQAIASYNLKTYDRIEYKVKKDDPYSKAAILAHVEKTGKDKHPTTGKPSIMAFIYRAIAETMERDSKGGGGKKRAGASQPSS